MGEIIHHLKMSKTWIPVAFIIGGIAFLAMAFTTPDAPVGIRLMMVFSGILFFLVAPDMHVFYGLDGIKLTFGPNQIWKVRIKKDDIYKVSIVEFNAMLDFGGWGIKGGRGKFKGVLMWAWVNTGNRGILVETASGKKYLIGDEDPEDTFTYISGYYPVQ